MQIFVFFFAFLFTPVRIKNVQRCKGLSRNKKIYMIENAENIENEFLLEMKKIKMVKHAGRDERYTNNTIDYELLNKIRQNIIKMELLNNLQNSNISIINKQLLLEKNKNFFIETDVMSNITAGGLMDHFFTDIEI